MTQKAEYKQILKSSQATTPSQHHSLPAPHCSMENWSSGRERQLMFVPEAGQHLGPLLSPPRYLGSWMLNVRTMSPHSILSPCSFWCHRWCRAGTGQAAHTAGTALHLPSPGLHKHSSARSHHTNSPSASCTLKPQNQICILCLERDVRDVLKVGQDHRVCGSFSSCPGWFIPGSPAGQQWNRCCTAPSAPHTGFDPPPS